ncbi:MAG: nucleotidyltransferase domain-containing protein [Thermotogaceae bacterium]|nr:nucleotidyltransferase domain-containing protein [Thermotogaceae bacterium]
MAKDENLLKIKEVIKNIFPDCRAILFGSRSRKDFKTQSDYDILVIIKKNLNIKEKFQYESIIRKHLAQMEIDTDIIVKSEDDIPAHLKRIDSVVKEALETGVVL